MRMAPSTPRAPIGVFAFSLPACALVVGIVGVLRLGRQFPSAAQSPSLLVPFLLPVLALALEAGGLVALSISVCSALGRAASAPVATRVRLTLPLVGLLALVLAVAETIPRGTDNPGLFANELLSSARRSCGPAGQVEVPLLGLHVRCGSPQRIEGPMPGAPGVRLAMNELMFSDDLRRVQITALDLNAKRSLSVHLQAGTARIAGLAPWSRSPRLSPLMRLAILGGLGFALWLVACGVIPPAVRTETGRPVSRHWRFVGLAVFALPGAVTAWAFISLDQERAIPGSYASAALWGALAVGALGVVGRRAPRIFSSFYGF